MSLLNFFQKSQTRKGLLGIATRPDGVALAHVVVESDKPPHLLYCNWIECNESEFSDKLEQQLDEHDLSPVTAATLMPANEFNLLLVEAPEVESSELRQAVRWKIKDLLDYHVDDAVVDICEIPDPPSHRNSLMYAVAAKESVLKERIETLEIAGASLEYIDIPELVQRNLAMLYPEEEQGIITIQLGHADGLLTITRKGTLYLARQVDVGTLPLFGAYHSLLQPSKIPAEEGLSLEMSPTDELDEFGLNGEVREQLDQLVLEIQRSSDYYTSHYQLPQVSKIVITPIAEATPGLVDYMEKMLGIEVDMLDFNSRLHSDLELSREQQAYCSQAIAVALRDISAN